ncbi:MAG: hypothetical protein LBS92_04925 [Candidatus Methanoplasma sp.]|nr:hypothetical protein [Candidatus Methanoplasma sp.]
MTVGRGEGWLRDCPRCDGLGKVFKSVPVTKVEGGLRIGEWIECEACGGGGLRE